MTSTRTLIAFNTATASENKIHDDSVASRFGFTGGLVPGVDVFAYLAHAPMAAWGQEWLAGGQMRARFNKPVYDGDPTTVTAELDGGPPIAQSQVLLFVIFISSAIGVLIGGIVGDRIGRHRIIWISILGPLPLTLLLPHVGLAGTVALTVLINLIMASAFASIMLYAMELMPGRIGLIGGVFYGLNFALGGVAAALLGALADRIGLHEVYVICSFLPLVGLVTWFLPKTGT